MILNKIQIPDLSPDLIKVPNLYLKQIKFQIYLTSGLLDFQPLPEENALNFTLTNLKLNIKINEVLYDILIPIGGYVNATATNVLLQFKA